MLLNDDSLKYVVFPVAITPTGWWMGGKLELQVLLFVLHKVTSA